jgi:hypothetical protein
MRRYPGRIEPGERFRGRRGAEGCQEGWVWAAVPLAPQGPSGLSTEAVQRAVRVNVTCVTPLGEEVASTW